MSIIFSTNDLGRPQVQPCFPAFAREFALRADATETSHRLKKRGGLVYENRQPFRAPVSLTSITLMLFELFEQMLNE